MKIQFQHTLEVRNHIGLCDVQVTTDGTIGDCVIDIITTKDGDEVDLEFVKEKTLVEICDEALEIFRDRASEP